ncbi:hypothetical protein ACSYDW_17565 [Paeniglutamicibacter sp. R2-26]|uniref:hypothetical protein n=1 Tax=Paeniglutamicibacter sp. R2-26 TaxID=3144417 RepID=UPI003EE5790C
MNGSARTISFADISRKMLLFARYLYSVHLPQAAEAFEDFARQLERGVTDDRLNDICNDVLSSLRAGPMTIGDRYITKPDGSPDSAETDNYYALIDELRKFARSNLHRKKTARFFHGFRR